MVIFWTESTTSCALLLLRHDRTRNHTAGTDLPDGRGKMIGVACGDHHCGGISLTGLSFLRANMEYNVKTDGKHIYLIYITAYGIYPNASMFIKILHLAEAAAERRYSLCRKSVRKRAELMKGGIKSRFEILQRDIQYFDESCHNMCERLHNLIFLIQQNGGFKGDKARTDIFIQFCEQKWLTNMQIRTELYKNVTIARRNVW